MGNKLILIFALFTAYNCLGNNQQGLQSIKVKHFNITEDSLSLDSLVLSYYNGYNLACYNDQSGFIQLYYSGGNAPYSIYLNDSLVGDSINNLSAGSYNILIEDASGEQIVIETTLNEPPFLSLEIAPIPTLYYGYNATFGCTNINGTASGGMPPYTFEWNTGALDSTIYICPDSSTTFILSVMDANGCISTKSEEVCVIDVRCEKGGNAISYNQGEKVVVCHIPPGNPENKHDICVSKNAVPAHLAHGDSLGSCNIDRNCNNDSLATAFVNNNIDMNVSPNPANANSVLQVMSGFALNGNVVITTLNGQIIVSLEPITIQAKELFQMPLHVDNIQNGAYLIHIYSENGGHYVKQIIVQN